MQLLVVCKLVLLEEIVLDNNLFIYFKNLQEDSNTWFMVLRNIKIPDWIISSFDIEVENINLDRFLKEFIEMTFDLEVKSMYTL